MNEQKLADIEQRLAMADITMFSVFSFVSELGAVLTISPNSVTVEKHGGPDERIYRTRHEMTIGHQTEAALICIMLKLLNNLIQAMRKRFAPL